MRLRYDHRAKALLSSVLEGLGEVTIDATVTLDAQRADLAFEPSPHPPPRDRPPDLLERMAFVSCLFEPFGRAPTEDELEACMRKRLAFARARRRAAPRGAPVPKPWLWVLAAGRPSSALRELGFEPFEGWPAGVYAVVPWRLGAAVLSELPEAYDTLSLRLLGRGKVLARALRELSRLPQSDSVSRRVVPALLSLGTETEWANLTGVEGEMATWDWKAAYKQWETQTLARGEARGEARGRALGEAKGLRVAIADLCESMSISLSPERRARLEQAGLPELEALRLALKQTRRWPDN